MVEEKDKIIDIEIYDDIFGDDEEQLSQPTNKSVLYFEPTEKDAGITLDRLFTLSRSNRPDVARAARDALLQIEDEALDEGLTVEDLDRLTFPTPKIMENLGGVQFERRIGEGASEEFKEAARESLRKKLEPVDETPPSSGGGGGGGGGGSSYGGSSPSDYGDAESELEVYLDEWESDDWQLLRSGYSVEDILIEKWESANGQDWDDYLAERDEFDDGDF